MPQQHIPAAILPNTLVREAVRNHERGRDFRMHWIALGAAGLRIGERIHVAKELDVILNIVLSLGFEKADSRKTATMVVVHRPTNNELLSMVNRLEENVRLVVYNEECDLQAMSERTFDLATACIFDQESKRVVRIYDKPCKVKSYIEIELADISDSSISVHATRIATLR